MNQYKFVEDQYGNCELLKKNKQTGEWDQDLAFVDPTQEMASKKYVNDKIKEANPDFKGTYTSMDDIEAIEDANANDWAYLVTPDENGNDVYSRYRYTLPAGATQYQWVFEVAIKRDNFTDDEWAAITSGITSDKVQRMVIAMEVSDITALTAAQIETLKIGYVVNKVTGNSKHSYIVKYKNDVKGEMSLVYCDHENIEEVYYEKRNGDWTYVQTDNTPLDAKRFAEISELVGDRVLTSIEIDENHNYSGVYKTLEEESE